MVLFEKFTLEKDAKSLGALGLGAITTEVILLFEMFQLLIVFRTESPP